jgi:murein L,D-transpeptidase YcbB/YkuD
MKKTFLYRVYQHNRKLFYILTAFTVLTVITNLLGDEVTPFFVWGMYSEKEKPVQEYEVLKTTINEGAVVNTYNYSNGDTRFYLNAPLAYYKKIKDNNDQDPTITFLQTKLHQHYDKIRSLEHSLFNTGPQQQAFLSWYARYLQQVTGLPVTSLRVEVVHVHYTDKDLVPDSVNLFAAWQRP